MKCVNFYIQFYNKIEQLSRILYKSVQFDRQVSIFLHFKKNKEKDGLFYFIYDELLKITC